MAEQNLNFFTNAFGLKHTKTRRIKAVKDEEESAANLAGNLVDNDPAKAGEHKVEQEFKDAFNLEQAKKVSSQDGSDVGELERERSEKPAVNRTTRVEYSGDKLQLKSNLPQKPVVNENAQALIQQLVSENLDLKRQIWKLQYTGTRRIAGILSGAGAAFLSLSYFADSLVLTFMGLGLVLWGVLMLFISPSRQVRAEVVSSAISVMQKSIENLLAALGYTGQVIFFHPNTLKGLAHGYIFVSHLAAKGGNSKSNDVLNLLPYSSESEVPSVYLHPSGVFIASPSQGLVDLFEKELLTNFASIDLPQIQRTLPKLLIEDLRLVDQFEIVKNDDNTISVEISGGPYEDLCKSIRNELKSSVRNSHIGCVFCSALALIFSKVLGNPIIIEELPVQYDEHLKTIFVEMVPTQS